MSRKKNHESRQSVAGKCREICQLVAEEKVRNLPIGREKKIVYFSACELKNCEILHSIGKKSHKNFQSDAEKPSRILSICHKKKLRNS